MVRELTSDELADAWLLGRHAFGGPRSAPPPRALEPAAGVTRLGAFDGAGRLIGKANDLHHDQWWGGVPLHVADVGGVVVAPEARGRGVARSLLRRLLEGGRERGAALSALYPTVSAVYRSAGWAPVGALRSFDLPSSLLPRHVPTGALSVRPGAPADMPALGRLYTEIARARNGMLTRSGPPFAAARGDLPDGIDGLTVVEDGDRMVGCATWSRLSGFGPDAVLEIDDLFAITRAAARELVGVLASWRTVTPTIRLRAIPSGVVAAELPLEVAKDHKAPRWMLRPVDVTQAVTARSWPSTVKVGVRFELRDDLAPWNAGIWALEIADGRASLERSAGPASMVLEIDGFAMLYAGVASPAMLVEAGAMVGGVPSDLAALALLMASPLPELLDFF